MVKITSKWLPALILCFAHSFAQAEAGFFTKAVSHINNYSGINFLFAGQDVTVFFYLTVMSAYFFAIWYFIGRKNKFSTQQATALPQGISPYMAQYLLQMSSNYKILANVLVGLALKGALKIYRKQGLQKLKQIPHEPIFEHINPPPANVKLTTEEKLVIHHLFTTRAFFVPNAKIKEDLDNAKFDLEDLLKASEHGPFFRLNYFWLIPALPPLYLINYMFFSAALQSYPAISTPDPVLVFIPFIIPPALACLTAKEFEQVKRYWSFYLVVYVTYLVLSAVFFADKHLPYDMFWWLIGNVASFAFMTVFLRAMRGYTRASAQTMARIAGLREYLLKNANNLAARPLKEAQKTFTDYYTTVLALGIEKEWEAAFVIAIGQQAVYEAFTGAGIEANITKEGEIYGTPRDIAKWLQRAASKIN